MAKAPALLLVACAIAAGCTTGPESRQADAVVNPTRVRDANLADRFAAAQRKGYSGAIHMPLPIRAPGSMLAAPSADKKGLQLEVISVEPLTGGCPAAGAATSTGIVLQVESPFWNRSMAQWVAGCGTQPRNLFMEKLADQSGWVRPAPLPVEDAHWGRSSPVPAGVPQVSFASPAKAVFRVRWEMADKSISEWETVSLVAGPYEDFLVMKPLTSAADALK